MISFIIDGKKIKAENREILLKIALDNNIDIPHLCYHRALIPFGACRLCLVEIIKNNSSKIVASCTYPVEKDIEVKTNSERVIKNRKLIIELLLARCSNVDKIKELALKFGIEKPRFPLEDNDCILCGLCTRVCTKVLEDTCAIDFSNRGIDTQVTPPFDISSEVCIGCGACTYICPTNAIKTEKTLGIQEIKKWQIQHELVKCKTCGDNFITLKQIHYLKEKFHFQDDVFENCPKCKRKEYAKMVLVHM